MNARKQVKNPASAPKEGAGARWEPSKEERPIPSPDWKQWDASGRVTLEDAVLLSLNFCPDFFLGESTAQLLHAGRAKNTFDERLRRLRRHHTETTILLSDFASLAKSEFKWEGLPDDLMKLATKPTTAPVSNADIPGKLPKTGVGKLAIKAAWQIECETSRAAIAKDVMTRLQGWADAGSEPDVLRKSNKEKRGVDWQTMKGVTKTFDLGACEKALATWKKSRA